MSCSNCYYYYTIEGSNTVLVQKSEKRTGFSTETFEHKGNGFARISVHNNLTKSDIITAAIYVNEEKRVEQTASMVPGEGLTIETKLKK